MSEEEIGKKQRILAVIKLALLAILVVGVPAFIYIKYGSSIFSRDSAENIIAYLETRRSSSMLILIMLQVIQVVICVIPGQPIQFASSYMFGIAGALFISIAGAFIGVIISFCISRLLGRDAMHVLFGREKMEFYSDKINSARGIIIVFLIYLIPGIPKDIMSYAVGISEMRLTPFLAASTIGRIPGMMGSILFGYFFKAGNYAALIILVLLAAVITGACIIKRNEIYLLLDRIAQKNGL